MIEIIIEVEGGLVVGVYSNAHQGQDFEVDILDRDVQDENIEQEIKRVDTILIRPEWRRID